MTGRHEPRTVQFVFKASPEEEITRSVITTTSVHHHDYETHVLVNGLNSEQQKLSTEFNNNLNESPNHDVYPNQHNKGLSVQVRTAKPLESNRSNQISNTESPQYRARDKSREFESVGHTRQSNINVVQRLARHFEEEQQTAAGLLSTKQDGGTEDVNNFSTSTTILVNLDPVKTINKEIVAVYQINHATASSQNAPVLNEKSVEDLAIIDISAAESKADVTAHPVSAGRNGGGENEKLFQNNSPGREKGNNNSSNERVRDILHLQGVRESSSFLAQTAGKSENGIEVLPTKCVQHNLSKAHWYETGSLTQQQLVSPGQGTPDSPLPPVKPYTNLPPPALREHKPNLRAGNNPPQTRHRGLPNHMTRFQEYTLPQDFGNNKESKNSRPEFSLERNDVGYYYPKTRNENFSENNASCTPENNSIKTLSSEINKPSSLFRGRTSRPQREIDSSVDLEYYDINSDQELNSMITRRQTNGLNDDEESIEYVTPTKRELASSEEITSTEFTDVPQRELGKFPEERKGKSNTVSSLQSTGAKPSHLITDSTRSFDKIYPNTRNQVDQYPQRVDHIDSKTNFYRTGQDDSGVKKSNCVGEAGQRYERDHALLKVGRHMAGNHVPGKMEDKVLRNNNFAKEDVPVKTLDYTGHSYSLNEGPTGVVNGANKSSGKKYRPSAVITQDSHASEENRESRASKSIPVKINMLGTTENVDESNQGSYNIREAETYWNQRHKHIDNNLPRTTPKDGISNNLTHNESFCDSKNDSYSSIDLDFRRFASEDQRRESYSTSSLITADSYDDSDDLMGGNDFTGIQTKEEFKTTLKQLSRYVLAGYKENLKRSQRILTPRKNMLAGVEPRRYHLDEEEAELSEVKKQASDFKRLCMVANVISRLREIYTVIPLPKPLNKDKNYAKLHHSDNGRGNALLCDAIENQAMSEVKKVILSYSNVDVNLCSHSGYSSLHKAAEEGDIEGLRFLIEHGADLNVRDRAGFPPVHNALQRYHYKAAMFLMDCGTDMMSYTSKRIQEFVKVKATAKQFLRQNLKTRL